MALEYFSEPLVAQEALHGMRRYRGRQFLDTRRTGRLHGCLEPNEVRLDMVSISDVSESSVPRHLLEETLGQVDEILLSGDAIRAPEDGSELC